MKQGTDKITTLLKKHPSLKGTLDDIRYTLDNAGPYSDCVKLWNTFFFGIGIEERCPTLRTFRKYFYQKKSNESTKQYIKVLAECQEEPRPQSNAVKGDARNDKSKWYKPDLT